jgi:NAD(P)-dependent dehydrogenase (short-subunit alcohol dehydrogenase family)
VLTGKSLIVTGATSGIGADAVHLFLEQGARVVAVGRDGARLSIIRSELKAFQTVEYVEADLSDSRQCDRVATAALEAFGKIDGLANFAGTWVRGSVLELSEEEWDRAFDCNSTTAWLMTRAALPGMIRAGGGSIVYVSSVLGINVVPSSTAYSCAKAALLQLSRSVALDYGPHGVRSNALCPGLTQTPMTTNVFADRSWIAKLLPGYPLGRLGAPRDITSVAAFLLSDLAGWITGASIPVDGGYLLSAEHTIECDPDCDT